MKEFKSTKTYLGHLTFYYLPTGFVIPISVIFDKSGLAICFGFWGLSWTWKREDCGHCGFDI